MRHVGVHPCSKVERCPPPRQPPPRPPPRNTRRHLPSCRDATQTRIRALLRAWHAIQGSLPSQSSVATPAQTEKPSRTPPEVQAVPGARLPPCVDDMCRGGGGGFGGGRGARGGGGGGGGCAGRRGARAGRMGMSGLLKPVASSKRPHIVWLQQVAHSSSDISLRSGFLCPSAREFESKNC
jgi:hypothetical protein